VTAVVCEKIVKLASAERNVRPIVGYQSWRFRPRILNQRGLEPTFSQIGVLCNDQLKARGILRSETLQRLEQPPNCLKIGILWLSVCSMEPPAAA
jgi:hypothetical protein